MQRRTVRRWSPTALTVALSSLAALVAAVTVSQADLLPEKAVSVAMLSGGEGSLPAANLGMPATDPALRAPPPVTAESSPAPEPPPTTAGPTTTTARKSPPTTAASTTTTAVAEAPAHATRAVTPPCPDAASAAKHACPPPCPPSGSANAARACPPPCAAQPAAPPTGGAPAQPSPAASTLNRPACPPPCGPTTNSAQPCPPTCRLYDPASGATMPCPPPCYRHDPGSASGAGYPCPPPCPAYATADGRPAPCLPSPCPQYATAGSGAALACPPPCAYPTEPVGSGTGGAQPQVMIACPPPCPSAAPSEESCTPPCSYPGGGGSAAAFAPCPAGSGVAGRVTAGPTCPVERPDEPCADKAVETTVRLLRNDGSVAATAKSAPDGSFRLAAAPGSYRLIADWPSPVGGCAPVEVTAEPNRFTHSAVTCDTGIR